MKHNLLSDFYWIRFLGIFLLGMITFSSYGQDTQTVSGRIIDEGGEGLPGVTILVKGGVDGTITDLNGDFTLDVKEDAVLTLSFIGYKTVDVPLNGRSTINYQIEEKWLKYKKFQIMGLIYEVLFTYIIFAKINFYQFTRFL